MSVKITPWVASAMLSTLLVSVAGCANTDAKPEVKPAAKPATTQPTLAKQPISKPKPAAVDSASIVSGRCHQGSCWWWQVGEIGIGDKEGWDKLSNPKHPGDLFKVPTRIAEMDFPDGKYPATFPKDKKPSWSKEVTEGYIYCSASLPVYFEPDEGSKQYVGTVLFNEKGEDSGATEGAGNLYRYVCGERDTPPKKVSAGMAFETVVLDKPEDIFTYVNKAEAIKQAEGNAPQRISFARGASSATVSGKFDGFEGEQSFVLKVGKGKTLSVDQVNDDAHYTTLAVIAPNGEEAGDLAADCHNHHKIKPTVAGDYTIRVTECRKADEWKGSYSLKVTVK